MLLVALALAIGAQAPAQETPQTPKRRPGVASVVYVLEIDPARARTVGWAPKEASEDEALEASRRVVEQRMRAMQRACSLQVVPGSHRLELTMPQVQPRDRELFSEMFQSLGLLEFVTIADEASTVGLDIDFASERNKFDAWRQANPTLPLAVFHALAGDKGPHPRLCWAEALFETQVAAPLPLLLPDQPEDHLGAASLERAYSSRDSYGYPAVGIELSATRAGDFERWTDANLNRRMAIVVEGRIRSAPTLASKLENLALIEGRFTEAEVTHIVEAFTKRRSPLSVVEIR